MWNYSAIKNLEAFKHTILEKSFNFETSKKYNINEKDTTKLNSFTKHSESFPQQPPLYGYVFDLLTHYKVAKENWYKTTKTNKKMVDIQIFIAIKTKIMNTMLVLQVFNVKCILIYSNYITILNTETKHHTTKHNYQHYSMYIHLVSSCRIFCTSSSSLTIHSTAKLSNAKPEPKK